MRYTKSGTDSFPRHDEFISQKLNIDESFHVSDEDVESDMALPVLGIAGAAVGTGLVLALLFI